MNSVKYLISYDFSSVNKPSVPPKDPTKGIQRLPKEILSVIFSLTDAKTLITVIPLVSKQWKDITTDLTLLKGSLIKLINANLLYKIFIINVDWKNATKQQCLSLYSQLNKIDSLEKKFREKISTP